MYKDMSTILLYLEQLLPEIKFELYVDVHYARFSIDQLKFLRWVTAKYQHDMTASCVIDLSLINFTNDQTVIHDILYWFESEIKKIQLRDSPYLERYLNGVINLHRYLESIVNENR